MSRFGAGGSDAAEAVEPGPAGRGSEGDFLPLCSEQTRRLELDGPFRLESGEVLPRVSVAYRSWGRPGSPTVLVCHALTGSADVDDWWPGLLAEGGPLDPARYHVLCSNVVGGCYGTTGPSKLCEEDGRLVGLRFPLVTIRDLVRVQARWLDALGVDTLDLVIGGSMGGMQVLEWASLFPERVRAIVPVAVSTRHSAWCIGFSQSQRRALAADPRWSGGVYRPDDAPRDGMEVARQIAMISYRSPSSFTTRFDRRRSRAGPYEVESYLDHHGRSLRGRFDPASYYRLTQAMDTHDLARGRGSVSEALAAIRQPALVLGVDSDVLYPLSEQRELAEGLPDARLEVVSSPHGHDGFLIEQDQVSRVLGDFLRTSAV